MNALSALGKKMGLGLLLFFVCMVNHSLAAESSSEMSVSDASKEQLRQQILGSKVLTTTDREYVIGYRDVVYVEVYGEGSMAVSPETSSTSGSMGGGGATVGVDGRMSLRHIGEVYVVGMTLPQLANYLKKLYDTVFEDPTIITALMQSNSRQYTVMGQVRNPGLYPLDAPLNVVQAISKAGGFTEWADSEISILRTEGSKPELKSLPVPGAQAVAGPKAVKDGKEVSAGKNAKEEKGTKSAKKGKNNDAASKDDKNLTAQTDAAESKGSKSTKGSKDAKVPGKAADKNTAQTTIKDEPAPVQQVIPTEPTKMTKYTFDYDDFLKGKDAENNISLESGDVIMVH